jgi:hypothetical protein
MNDQALPLSFISSRSRIARLRFRRKFSSMTKNEETPISSSSRAISSYSSSPVA